jgi:hypothetical protein
VPALERFEEGRALLADGTRVEVDAVIAATGFRAGLEPLVGHLGVRTSGVSRFSTLRTSTLLRPASTSSATGSLSAARFG